MKYVLEILKNKRVYIPLIIISLALIIFFYGKKMGKISLKPKKLPGDLPGMGNLSENENAQVMTLSRRLYEDLKGVTIFWRDVSVYTDFMAMNDRLFIAVYNYYNETYAKDHMAEWGTLKQWIMDEKPQGVGGATFGKIKPSILERMDNLKLI